MKVKINNYPGQRLICNIYEKHMDKKYDPGYWVESQSHEDHVMEAIDDAVQSVYDVFNRIWFDRRKQKFKVRIDKWDTWSMDHTLAPIILPMLVQLKETNHGAPNVAMSDVPKELRATKAQLLEYAKSGEADPKHFERWDWIMGEMIWAFEQKCRNDWMVDYYGEWVEDPTKPLGGSHINYDDEGRKKHQERMTNGFRLFGIYFENLWD